MSTVTAKEKNLLMITAVLALYAVAALCYKKQAQEWKITKRTYDNAQRKLQEEQALIAATDQWDKRYEELRTLMPVFPYERAVDTHWLNIMDSVAASNNLTISRRQANKEVEVGDVYELPIECRDWEGTLDSLVRFLYDLQKEGAMLDVRQLFMRPSNRPGFLKGTFTLYCAYMRGDTTESESVKSITSDEGEVIPLEKEDKEPGAADNPGEVENQDIFKQKVSRNEDE